MEPTLKSQYIEFMKEFFKRHVDGVKEANSKDIAWQFSRTFGDSNLVDMPLVQQEDIYSISVLTDRTSMSYLTRRVPLVADTTMFSHKVRNPFKGERYEISDSSGLSFAKWDEVHSTDMNELGIWLKSCKPLLLNGDIFYFPNYAKYNFTRSGGIEMTEKALADFVVENRKLIDVVTTNPVKSQLVRPVLQIDLPYIENVDIETFCKITADERDALENFRDFLRLIFLDLEKNEDSELFETNLAKIGVELRNGVRELEAGFQVLKRKRPFQATGAVIAATTAVLVALNSETFGMLPEILGTSGGMLAIANILEKHVSDKRRLQDNPHYYLWLFSQKGSGYSQSKPRSIGKVGPLAPDSNREISLALTEENQEVRIKALRQLSVSWLKGDQPKTRFEALRALLREKNSEVRNEALKGLMNLVEWDEDKDITVEALKTLSTEEVANTKVRLQILETLTRYAYPEIHSEALEALRVLSTLAQTEDREVRTEAKRVLFAVIMAGKDPMVCHQAMRTLADLAKVEKIEVRLDALGVLRQIAKTTDLEVRVNALRALAESNDTEARFEAFEALGGLVGDKNLGPRHQALRALAVLARNTAPEVRDKALKVMAEAKNPK